MSEVSTVKAPKAVKKPELTHLALGTYVDEKGYYHLVKIKYNPLTGDVGELETEPSQSPARGIVADMFKTTAVKQGVLP